MEYLMTMHPTKIISVSTFALTLLLSAPVKGMNGADAIQTDFREILVQAHRDNAEALRDAVIAKAASLDQIEAHLRNNQQTWTLVNLKALDRAMDQLKRLIASLKGSAATKVTHRLGKTAFFVNAQNTLTNAQATRNAVWQGLSPQMRTTHTFDYYTEQLAVLRGLNPEIARDSSSALQIIHEITPALRFLETDENIPTNNKRELRNQLIAQHTRFTRN